jgi:hypothetical protein
MLYKQEEKLLLKHTNRFVCLILTMKRRDDIINILVSAELRAKVIYFIRDTLAVKVFLFHIFSLHFPRWTMTYLRLRSMKTTVLQIPTVRT